MEIKLDRSNKGIFFKGLGMVSGNNSSRLLIDYKYKNPQRYNEILQAMFGRGGLNIKHFKLEMGSDINSSSGTEPCVMRCENETADVTRGAGFILACDAQKINNNITLDMLFWSEPKWVSDSSDLYAARYKWYKENLCAAYNTFGLKFDYISVSRNERAIDGEWIKYISAKLKSDKNCPYDFSRIKIVAADEENSWHIADMMISDKDLCNAVDIVASHYTSHSTDNVRLLADKYSKTIWFSEGCPPASYSKGTSRFYGSGLAGINGVLDIACRIAAMYPCGGMNLYEFQPVTASYYDGVCYCCKQLITANEPWSGHYTLDSGYYMALHFSQFFPDKFIFIDSGCFCDGEKGGDGHALVNVRHCAMTAGDIDSGHFSSVLINPTAEEIAYEFDVSIFEEHPKKIFIWETRGSDGGEYNENYFKRIREFDFSVEFSVTLKPFSMLTVSTVSANNQKFSETRSEMFPLPYHDDFSYDENYLKQRGYSPEFTSDQGGAFEIRKVDGKNVLMQIITHDIKAEEWGGTPLPVTNLGDDRWYNYSVTINGFISKSSSPEKNYIGAGLRYIISYIDMSGCSILAFEDGHWEFVLNNRKISDGKYSVNDGNIHIKISADNNKITAYLNEKKVYEYLPENPLDPLTGAGRAALYSSYHNNYFTDLIIEPVSDEPYIIRYDGTDICFSYSDGWEHELMTGFSNYKRTLLKGKPDETFTLDFHGTGFGLFGENHESCVISAWIDDEMLGENIKLPVTKSREIFYNASGFKQGEHKVFIKVISGNLCVDGAEIQGK